MEIKELLGEEYLKRFKVYHPDTLFPPVFEALKVKRCPLCNCLLKLTQNKKLAMCRGKKHKRPFVITAETFYRITGK